MRKSIWFLFFFSITNVFCIA